MTSAVKAMKRFVMTEYKFPHYRNLESISRSFTTLYSRSFSARHTGVLARVAVGSRSITPIEAALAIRGPYVS